MKSALLKATVLSAGIAASLTVVDFQPANAAGFSGDYDPAFWGLGNFYSDGTAAGDGFVDETGAPGSITLFGSDDGSGFQGNTFYGTTLAGSLPSYVSFDWAYGSFDNPTFDSFGYFVGVDPSTATYTSLAGGGIYGPAAPDNQGIGTVNGTVNYGTFLVNPGESFGFYVETADNLRLVGTVRGDGFATISNFNVTAVPTPALLPGLIGMGVAALRKKQSEAEESEA